MTEVAVDTEMLEVVPSFYYLRDNLSSGGGCELATIIRCRMAWGKFNKLLPILTCCSFPFTFRLRQREGLQFICQEHHALHKWNMGLSLIWPASPATQWQGYDHLDVWCHHQGPSQLATTLWEAAGEDPEKVHRTCRLRWHGHIKHSDG